MISDILFPYRTPSPRPHPDPPQDLRIRPPCTGVKNPKIGRKGFRGQKKPMISPHPQKWAFRVKNSPFLHRPLFLTRNAHFWGEGKSLVFFDPGTLFSQFWGFWPLYRADGFATQDPEDSPDAAQNWPNWTETTKMDRIGPVNGEIML